MVQVVELPKQGRVVRRPQHTFYLRHKPWQIQPFLLAPVLPGETMENLLLQARAVTDPLKNPLMGWWLEYYFFYVKHRDLSDRNTLELMMVDPGTDVSSLKSTTSSFWKYFYGGTAGAIDWTGKCLQTVVTEFFRMEGESYPGAVIDSAPVAQINVQNWLDSVVKRSELATYDVSVNTADGLTASEIDTAMLRWQLLRSQGITTMSYEDYLAAHGIGVPEEPFKPELVRYIREWTYPTNTVNPADGNPSSAAVWSITETANKRRFFKEPGFLFGVTVCRPKVYLKNQKGSVASALDDAYSWLSPIIGDAAFQGLKEFASDGTTSQGPLTNQAEAYVVDLRDLFLYGDQFVNFDMSAVSDVNYADLPTAALQKRYPASADVDALFATGTATRINQDGVVSIAIAGRQVDQTLYS